MKNTFFAVLFALVGLYATAQTKVVEYPVMGTRLSDDLEIYQVEISDTAVVLKGDIYGRPDTSWASIASSSVLKGKQTGKVYRLVRATGIQLDQKIPMSASWNRSFTLQFQPVDKRDKSVDFDEMLSDGSSFCVNGIALEEKDLKKKNHCRIKGTVVDNPAYSRLMLMPEGTDPRVQEWISIPVRDGKFSYDLYTDKEEPYELYAWSDNVSGAWRNVAFFAENGEVEITLYSLNRTPVVHSEALLTKELLRFQQEMDERFFVPMQNEAEQLEREGKKETPEMKALHEQAEKTKDKEELNKIFEKARQLEKEGKAYTEEYKDFRKRSQEVYGKMKEFKKNYIQSTPTLVGLSLLAQQARRLRDGEDATPYITTYRTVYADKFPDNPMTTYMKNWVVSNQIKVGEKFIDFEAPDLNGVQHLLSEEIKGKVALIDLWASWCGPCRRTSISMIPVYEVYKAKGFTVVGVARERKVDDMKKAIAKDKYPWINLLELNDSGKIWERYGVGNGGGCTYLVDKDGRILAIHPTAEEVKAWLDKLL